MLEETLSAALLFAFGVPRKEGQGTGDKRNTLIVKLSTTSSLTISQLQALPTSGARKSLVGLAAINGFLNTRNVRTLGRLSKMSYDDQRNTLIVKFIQVTGVPFSTLQAMGDFELVSFGFSKGI